VRETGAQERFARYRRRSAGHRKRDASATGRVDTVLRRLQRSEPGRFRYEVEHGSVLRTG